VNYIKWLYQEQKKIKDLNDNRFNEDLYYTLEKIINKNN
jgi:hypothetical protein